ncbi:uncharacterized protein KD926_001866 [Aspergillus affinis]|uniref:uncharacterized protein n=1 Tax=Aspergillus affinis TaxID=1070780 RepID=UPI0022FE7A7E|nr:uncharacterized protein KD926_001866 [Aspergillus affinis]KAI9044044.1 hypothetical protein KD926_001866 [Aspergillus affinis]
MITTSKLANRSFTHCINDRKPLNLIVDTDPFSYNANTTSASATRYNSEIFMGIMIDTGTSEKSTAGYGQFQALQNTENITLDTSTAGQFGKSPGRFRFNLKDEAHFNFNIIVDIIYIDNMPLFYVVNEATRFQSGRWLKDISAKHTWDMLRMCWIDTYLGPPDLITHDAGKNFVSKEFKTYAKTINISTRSIPIEAHNSIGMIERYHSPLRRAYQIIIAEIPDIDKEIALQMAFKAINDSAGPGVVKPYYSEAPESDQIDQTEYGIDKESRSDPVEPPEVHSGPIFRRSGRTRLPNTDRKPAPISLQPVQLQKRGPGRPRKHPLPTNVFLQTGSDPGIQLYHVSRQKEVNGLLEKGVFEFLKSEDILPGTRLFNSRFVDEIKNKGTERAFEKSRLVIQAYNDQGKDLILTQSPTIQRVSQRLILCIASNATFAESEEIELQKAQFLAKDREKLTIEKPLKFNGSMVKLEPDGITLIQETQCIKLLPIGKTTAQASGTLKDRYIAERARGTYIASICQPEASFDLSFAAQVINPSKEDAEFLNKRLNWQLENATRSLKYVKLDLESL